MAQAGHDVTVLTSDPGGKLPVREEVEGVHVRRVRAWPADRDYYFAPGIYREIVRGRWDIIHCQCYHTLVTPVAMLAALRSRTPYVLTFHSGGHSSGLRNAIRGIQREVLRPLLARADKLIGVSRFEADFFRKHLRLPRSKFIVVYNGSTLPVVEGLSDEPRQPNLIVSVGRLERYKGHQRAIAALPGILKERPDARLRIVGGGPYEAELRRLAEQLGVASQVEIGAIPPGDRAGMARVLASAALVVLFSEYEAHPVSVMEALAMGCPVLVTDTSGLGELADLGLVHRVPMASSDDEIAGAVLSELEHPLRRQAPNLPTWDGCAARLVGVYRSVLGARPQPELGAAKEPEGSICAS
jgi:glycosyltransferase involved in cell wall biosynthesis